MEDVGTLYVHLVCFMVIWYILPFWYAVPRKIWQPWPEAGS
jgi:hypothetical protein